MNIQASNGVMNLGHQMDNLATVISFPIGDLVADLGEGGSWSVRIQRNGDVAAYPTSNFSINGNILNLNLTSSDLAVVGEGQIQLKYTVGSKVLMSRVYRFYSHYSLDGSGTVPAPWQSWVDAVEDDADRAEEAVLHYPYVDTTTKHWMQWDVETEQFVDTGVSADGCHVSGTHDGTNWQTITIAGVTKNIPTGGGSGTSDFEQLTNRPKYNGAVMDKDTNIPSVPTKTSQLQNDSGFLTQHQSLADLQPKADNSLNTTSKQVVGAINEVKGVADGKSVVSASASGTSTDEINYLTINGAEKKIASGCNIIFGSDSDIVITGGSGVNASIKVQGDVNSTDTCNATKGAKTKNGVWTPSINPAWKGLPSGYTQYTFIRTNGAGSIDTGRKPSDISYWELDVQYTANPTAAEAFFINGLDAGITFKNYTEYNRFQAEFKWSVIGTSTRDLNRHKHKVSYSGNTGSYYIDNVLQGTATDTHEFPDATMVIGARRQGGALTHYCKEDVHGSTFGLIGGGIAEQIPCRRNIDNAIGLYDLEANTFLECAGTWELGILVPQYLGGYFVISVDEIGTWAVHWADGTHTHDENVYVAESTEYTVTIDV